MGRKLRSTLPILPTQLKPSWKALRGFRTKDKQIRAQQKRNFDKRHRVRDLPFLHPNTYAWIDTPASGRQPGVVQHSHHTPRSYIVKTESSACSHYVETVGILHHCLHKVIFKSLPALLHLMRGMQVDLFRI